MRNDILKPNNLYIEDAKILPGKFRHFSGIKDAWNGKGDINFCIVIPAGSVAVRFTVAALAEFDLTTGMDTV